MGNEGKKTVNSLWSLFDYVDQQIESKLFYFKADFCIAQILASN